MTLEDSERALILQTLEATGGGIGAEGGGHKLGLNWTTLIYRMKKLGIYRRFHYAWATWISGSAVST